MRVLAGTSGYSYKEWKGKFYPQDIAPSAMLGFYAQCLPAVEINNTFYRMPKQEVVENWRRQVPEDFRFAIKATQRISHRKRLKDAGEETRFLFDALRALGKNLGAVLFQMPPYFRKDKETLDRFLDLLPSSTPCAFEFRHESWFEHDIIDSLQAHNKTLCIADDEKRSDCKMIQTSDVGYLRLRRVEYGPRDLASWAESLNQHHWKECFVFFKHEDECGGPELAQSFLDITTN